MATFTVKQGKRYRATITLGWLERWAGNETIAERLRAAGFSEVSVSGSGGTRMAEAVWAGPSMRLRPERLADSDVVLVESENDIVIVDPRERGVALVITE